MTMWLGDSGLTVPHRRTFEDAIVAALGGMRRLAGYGQSLAEFVL